MIEANYDPSKEPPRSSNRREEEMLAGCALIVGIMLGMIIGVAAVAFLVAIF